MTDEEFIKATRPLVDMLWSAHLALGSNSGFVRHQAMLAIGGFLCHLPLDTYPCPKQLEGLDAHRINAILDAQFRNANQGHSNGS